MSERPEWKLAAEILDHLYQPTPYEVRLLAREVQRLRDLAEVKYELLRAEKGLDVRAELTGRIDKLYMALNAESRGDTADFDGEPLDDGKLKWNRLISLAVTATVGWIAAERWAAIEHRAADEMRASLAMVSEGAPV